MQVALKLMPDRKKFYDMLGGDGTLDEDIEQFVTKFSPVLGENHKFLVSFFLKYASVFSCPDKHSISAGQINSLA